MPEGPDINKIPEEDADRMRKELADQLRKSVFLLNTQLRKASEYGMVVEVSAMDVETMGVPRHTMLQLKSYKEL